MLLILAIFLCIFSDKIDAAAKADKKLKKLLIWVCITLALANVVLIVISLKSVL